MTHLEAPTFTDVLEARKRISPYLRPTAFYTYPGLNELIGTETWVKLENQQPIAAFKVRGGINLVSQLSESERDAGLISASTGNHGQSIAYAGRLFGVRVIICVPENANPVKVASMQALGATVIQHGRDFDAAREHCEALAREHGYRYVHSGNEPLLIAGVATYALEMLEEQPDLDVILVPVGGGSGAAGTCLTVKTVRPETEVIGVQSSAAPAAYRSWKGKALTSADMTTFAEGLATRSAFDLPQRIMWDLLDDFVLVSDDDIRQAIVRLLETARTLVEPAGAAAVAAALQLRDRLAGKRVAVVVSGGNISPVQLRDILDRYVPAAG